MSQPTRPHRLIVMVSLALWAALLQPVAAQNYVLQLCNETNCNAAIVQLARIDDVFLFSNVTPGGTILLKGRGLANTTELTLKLTDFRGQPKSTTLRLLEVGDTFIGARILDGTSEVLDQRGTLQARTAANQYSNEFPVNFRAQRDFRLLPANDGTTKLISCGTDSNYDWCRGWVDPEDNTPSYPGTGPLTVPIHGSHHNCWGCVGNDSGTDEYEVTLANGWIIDSIDMTRGYKTNKNEAWASEPPLPPGASRWRPRIDWYATPNDTAKTTPST
jgi:hypothetical protein